MALLDALTRPESDRLWVALVTARKMVADEVAQLARCSRSTREQLYGPGILGATVGVLDWLDDVLETDLRLGPGPRALALVPAPTPEV